MGSAPLVVSARPELKELVVNNILRYAALNPQAFSGAQNPTTLYQLMVYGGALVFPFYREIEEKDMAISSALGTRKLLVLAREQAVQCADTENGQAKQYAEGLEDFLDRIPRFSFALNELLDAPFYGYSVVEIMWKWDGGQIRCERLIGRPQELFRFGKLIDPQTGPLLLTPFPGSEGAPVPPAKFITSTPQPRSGDQRGRPLARRLFWASWFKRNVLRLQLQFLEKGQGTVAVLYPAGADEQVKQQALDGAVGIYEETAIALPDTFKLLEKTLATTRTRFSQDFETLSQYLDAEMTRMILGQTLSTHGTEQGKGSQALGRVHQDTLYEFIRNDGADLEVAINEQLCAPWLLWTFGQQALDPALRPMWRIEKEPPDDVNAVLDQLAKARALGLKIGEQFAYERAQIPVPQKDEALLAPLAISVGLMPSEIPPANPFAGDKSQA